MAVFLSFRFIGIYISSVFGGIVVSKEINEIQKCLINEVPSRYVNFKCLVIFAAASIRGLFILSVYLTLLHCFKIKCFPVLPKTE